MIQIERIIFERAIKLWGREAQLNQASEEAAEFIVALCHKRRNRIEDIDLASEIADVRIMLQQVEVMYNIEEISESQYQFKMDRLRDRVIKKQSEVLASE